MSTSLAKVIPAGDAFMDASTYYNPFEYISADAEDFKIALASGAPHSFISAAAKIPNSGSHYVCGMGNSNAIELHKALIDPDSYAQPYLLAVAGVRGLLENYVPSAEDIEALEADITFNAAIDIISMKPQGLPTSYQAILGEKKYLERATLLRQGYSVR